MKCLDTGMAHPDKLLKILFPIRKQWDNYVCEQPSKGLCGEDTLNMGHRTRQQGL